MGRGRGCNYLSTQGTNVLRSVDGDMTRVRQRLKPCHAITLCCTANKPGSMVLISMLSISGPATPVSIDFGTTGLPTHPIARGMVRKNTTYPPIPINDCNQTCH